MRQKGMSSEVFKLALAVLIVAAVLAVMAPMFSGVRESGTAAINATGSALEELSQKIANRTANL